MILQNFVAVHHKKTSITKSSTISKENGYLSVHDYILHTKFNYEAIPGLTDKKSDVNTTESMNASCSEPDTLPTFSPSWKWKSQVPKDKSAVPSKILTQNDFPYDFEDGIEHWCVWKLGSDLAEDDISWGMEELRKRGIYKDVLYWVNSINLKSLPNIDHAHIVCLRSDSDQEYVVK